MPSVRLPLGLDGKLPQAKRGPSPTSAPSSGLSTELAWALGACRLDETQQKQGPGRKVSGGEEGRNTLLPDLEKKWKVKYLESNFSRPGGKCVGMFPKAWMSKPFPHPPPHLDGGPGACTEIVVEAASGPSPRGSGHFQGQSRRGWGMLLVRPQTSKDRPCAPGLPLPSWEGSSFSCKMLGPHHPNRSPRVQKGPPRQGDSVWDRHPSPSIRPVELGPWNGEPAAAKRPRSIH